MDVNEPGTTMAFWSLGPSLTALNLSRARAIKSVRNAHGTHVEPIEAMPRHSEDYGRAFGTEKSGR